MAYNCENIMFLFMGIGIFGFDLAYKLYLIELKKKIIYT